MIVFILVLYGLTQLSESNNRPYKDHDDKGYSKARSHQKDEQAEQFYYVHSERAFFGDLCEFMSSGAIVVQVLEGENAIASNREIMGPGR